MGSLFSYAMWMHSYNSPMELELKSHQHLWVLCLDALDLQLVMMLCHLDR